MRVICIDDKWEAYPGSSSGPFIKFGEIVTVAKAFKDSEGEWYNFSEYFGYDYEQCGFAPISEINETDFERNYQKETV